MPELGLVAAGVTLAILGFAVVKRPEAVVMALGVYLFVQSAIVRVDDIPTDILVLLRQVDEMILALLVVRTVARRFMLRDFALPAGLWAFIAFGGVGLSSWALNAVPVPLGGVGLFLAMKSGLWLFVAVSLRYNSVVLARYGAFIGTMFLASVALAIVQFVGVTLPWDAHIRRSGELAATSIWNQHTVFGSAMAVAFGLGLVALRLPGWRRYGVVLCAAAAIGVYLSTVRRLAVSIPVGIGAVIAAMPTSERATARQALGVLRERRVIIGAAIVLLLAVPVIGPRVVHITADTWDEYVVNAPERDRYVLYAGGFELLASSPIVGRGPGMYASFASVQYQSPIYEELRIDLPDELKMGAPYASLFGEFGLAGSVAFLAFLLLTGKQLVRVVGGRGAPLAGALASGGLFMLANMTVESVVHTTFSDSFISFFGFVAIGAALALSEAKHSVVTPRAPARITIAMNLGLSAVLFASLVGAVAVLSPSFGRIDDPRPNVVLIVVDDLSIETISLLDGRRGDGSGGETIPELIGEAGAVFNNAIAPSPSDCPSRVSLLTGQAAETHGVWGTEGGCYPQYVGSNFEDGDLPARLQQSGYRTSFVGNYLGGYGMDSFEVRRADPPPGWDDWHSVWGTPAYWSYRLNVDGRISGRGRSDNFYLTDLQTRAAVNDIQEADGRPFFMAIMPFTPHEPPDRYPSSGERAPDSPEPGPGNEGLYDDVALSEFELDATGRSGFVRGVIDQRTSSANRDNELRADALADHRGRLAAMASVEVMVSEVLRALADAGELENTYVVFTSDNGFHLGEHGLLPGGTSTPYESDVRVPLFIRGPGISSGGTYADLTATADLAATVLDIAQLSPPGAMDGRSLLPILRGEPHPWREAVVIRHRGSHGDAVPAWIGVRTEGAKLIEWADGTRELYDLVADPDERDNLIHSNPVLRTELELLLRQSAPGCTPEGCSETPNSSGTVDP